jgi:SAM-dependent methyltransferase
VVRHRGRFAAIRRNGPRLSGEAGDFRARDNAPAERNKQPILDVLARVLPRSGLVLEIASGTGQHAEHFAAALPGLIWQPSEPAADSRALLAARVRALGLGNLPPPFAFDVHEDYAPVERADAIVCINMIHIAPWSACTSLMRHASTLLGAGAPLVLYGPFMRGGAHTAPSNATFDRNLRARNATWGVRDLADVDALARSHGLMRTETIDMPANNLAVVWRRAAPPAAT